MSDLKRRAWGGERGAESVGRRACPHPRALFVIASYEEGLPFRNKFATGSPSQKNGRGQSLQGAYQVGFYKILTTYINRR